MPKVDTHPLLNRFSGTVGDLVFYQVGEETRVRRKGEPPESWSKDQVAGRFKFKDAAAYGRSVRDDPGDSAIYLPRARAKGCAPYHVALADYLNRPEVRDINMKEFTPAAGSRILVQAADDFQVAAVQVVIRTNDGRVLEQGQAAFNLGSGDWVYLSQTSMDPAQPIVVEATATDRPGHTGTKTVFWCFEAV